VGAIGSKFYKSTNLKPPSETTAQPPATATTGVTSPSASPPAAATPVRQATAPSQKQETTSVRKGKSPLMLGSISFKTSGGQEVEFQEIETVGRKFF
jgi:hypothetical protein